MKKEHFKNILLIAGSGQNVGKTTLACQVLQNLKHCNPIAVKITPHFHKATKGLVEMAKGENWILFEETDNKSTKDSSLYLQNGAVKSYLILTKDDGLKGAFEQIKKEIPPENPVVIESAALHNLINPGFFIVVLPKNDFPKKGIETSLHKADLIVISDGKKFYPNSKKIAFKKTWSLKTKGSTSS